MSAQAAVNQVINAAAPKVRSSVGVVVSAGLMTKTVKVRVPGLEYNKHLRKDFKADTNYLVHDEAQACREGDVVKITRIPKASRHKRYIVSDIITPFGVGERIPIETEEQRLQRWVEKRSAKLERRVMAKPWLMREYGIKKPEEEESAKSIREQLAELLKKKELK